MKINFVFWLLVLMNPLCYYLTLCCKDIKVYIKNSLLCIKYPFLYPRNYYCGCHWEYYPMRKYYNHLIQKSTKWDINNNYKLVITKYFIYYYAKFIKFLHDWVIQIFFCIPSYTILDSMPAGWRKAFGEELCQKIKKALLKRGGIKALLRYRVTDIKEKWSYLHWYDAWTTKEIQEILDEYEDISYRTCINCGKKAKYLSKGWIRPYCGECAEMLNNDKMDFSELI